MGLSRTDLSRLDTERHIAQSIGDILSTPIGSRVMRRDYGSDLPTLIDAPMNGQTAIEIYHATAEAIDLWEPRFALERVEIAGAADGVVDLALPGAIAGEAARLEVRLG